MIRALCWWPSSVLDDEQHALALTDVLMATGVSQMALACASRAPNQNGTGLAHESTGQEVTDQASVDSRIDGKVELLNRFAGD